MNNSNSQSGSLTNPDEQRIYLKEVMGLTDEEIDHLGEFGPIPSRTIDEHIRTEVPNVSGEPTE